MKIAAIALVWLLISGCVEWQTDPQGKVTSVGLPGVPVWKSQDQQKSQANGSRPAIDLAAAEISPDGDSSTPWLQELNRYRVGAGVGPVSENLELSRGSMAHATYPIKQSPQDPMAFSRHVITLGAAILPR